MTDEHAGILVVPQRVWAVDQMAKELDTFLKTSPTLANTLYRWTQPNGWVSHT